VLYKFHYLLTYLLKLPLHVGKHQSHSPGTKYKEHYMYWEDPMTTKSQQYNAFKNLTTAWIYMTVNIKLSVQ